ncbi:hypothetical protein [Falsirhodobacter deserti]|nr:hypothetical protein [Falsirhodobacter deserti]
MGRKAVGAARPALETAAMVAGRASPHRVANRQSGRGAIRSWP